MIAFLQYLTGGWIPNFNSIMILFGEGIAIDSVFTVFNASRVLSSKQEVVLELASRQNMPKGSIVKLGVISDTHARMTGEIPLSIRNDLTQVDLILTAGDITEKAVLDSLRATGNVRAVRGNMDSKEIKKILPDKMPLK